MKKEDSVIESLVMVKLRIGYLTGTAKSTQIVADAESKYEAQPGSVRATASMFTKKWLSPLKSSIGKMRKEFYNQTLPWDNSSWRVVPTTKYQALMDSIQRLRDETEDIHSNILRNWATLVDDSKAHLGKLYNPETFPTKQEFKDAFSIDFEQGAVASPDDARLVGLDDAAKKKIRAEMQSQHHDKIRLGTQDLVGRLRELVSDAMDRLGKEDQAGTRYATLMTKIQQVTDGVSSLNVLADPTISEACVEIKQKLGGWCPKAIRDEQMVRDEMAEAASSIQSKLDGIQV